MINAADHGFTERSNLLPNFTESHQPGDVHSHPDPSECRTHHLKYKDQTVLIEDITNIAPSGFQGVIKGFEPPMESYDGIPVGEVVTYEEKYIHVLSK